MLITLRSRMDLSVRAGNILCKRGRKKNRFGDAFRRPTKTTTAERWKRTRRPFESRRRRRLGRKKSNKQMTFLFKFRTRNSKVGDFHLPISISFFAFLSRFPSCPPSHSIFLSTCLSSSYFPSRSFCSTLGIARAKYEKERGLFFVFLPGALPID